MYCVGWFGKIVLNKVIRNKQILIDEDTCSKFEGDEFPGGNESLGERLSLEGKSGKWDLITGEGGKFDDGREKLVTFYMILAVQCTDGTTLRIWCGELTDLTL